MVFGGLIAGGLGYLANDLLPPSSETSAPEVASIDTTEFSSGIAANADQIASLSDKVAALASAPAPTTPVGEQTDVSGLQAEIGEIRDELSKISAELTAISEGTNAFETRLSALESAEPVRRPPFPQPMTSLQHSRPKSTR